METTIMGYIGCIVEKRLPGKTIIQGEADLSVDFTYGRLATSWPLRRVHIITHMQKILEC